MTQTIETTTATESEKWYDLDAEYLSAEEYENAREEDKEHEAAIINFIRTCGSSIKFYRPKNGYDLGKFCRAYYRTLMLAAMDELRSQWRYGTCEHITEYDHAEIKSALEPAAAEILRNAIGATFRNLSTGYTALTQRCIIMADGPTGYATPALRYIMGDSYNSGDEEELLDFITQIFPELNARLCHGEKPIRWTV